MSDLISRQAAIDAVVSAIIDGADAELVEGVMELLPSAQPQRKTGEWIGYNTEQDGWKRTDGSPVFMSCSECNGLVLNNGSAHWNYCPNCGSYMRKGEKENED